MNWQILIVTAAAIVLCACPADGPLITPDMGSNNDMGSETDSPDDTQTLALTGISPDFAPIGGTVTLTGRGFADGMTVRFGVTAPVDTTLAGASSATAVVPISAVGGAVTVTVRNPDGATASLPNAFTYDHGQIDNGIGFCQLQAQSPAVADAGSPSEVLYAIVFADGVTPGAGQGAGIQAELGWGTGDPLDWTWIPATYNIDIDGLTPGDLSNDEYGAAFTVPAAGTYNYLARFRIGDDTPWTFCDLDGSENGAQPEQFGVLTINAPPITACHLRFPHILENVAVNATHDFFGRVPTTNTRVELVVGPVGIDPRDNLAPFATVEAQLNPNPLDPVPGESEYTAPFTFDVPGEFAYAFRFTSDDGATWTFCGLSDAVQPSGQFSPQRMGFAAVINTPNKIDFCHVWQDTLADSAAAADGPLLTVEVFEDPLTVGNGGANAGLLEVEAAAIPREINPALWNTDWRTLPYKDLRVGEPNNYEYEGTVYDPASRPAAGNYNVVARVREVGTAPWTFCDIDESAPEFRLDAATRLTVGP